MDNLIFDMEYDKRIFARNLKRLMDDHKVKRADICRLLGVGKTAMSGYLAAKQTPRMDKVEKLAAFFGVMKSDLIEDKRVFEKDPKEKALSVMTTEEAIKVLAEDAFGPSPTQEQLSKIKLALRIVVEQELGKSD